MPGNITSAQSFGPNLLIKQGAKLVDNWMDVVEEFPAAVRAQLSPALGASEKKSLAEQQPLEFGLSGDQKAVYDALRPDQAQFIDSILDSVPLPQSRVLTALLELEMAGWVRQLPGKNFVRKL